MDKGAGDYGPPKLSSSSHFVVYWDRRERHQNALVMMRRTSLGIRRQIGPIVLQSPQGRMMNYSVTWTFRRSKLEELSNWWCALTFVRVLTTATSINKVDKFWISSHWADRNAAVIWCTYEALFSSNKSSTLNNKPRTIQSIFRRSDRIIVMSHLYVYPADVVSVYSFEVLLPWLLLRIVIIDLNYDRLYSYRCKVDRRFY